MPGTRWTPSSTIDQPSAQRALDRRLDADEHVARLVEEAEEPRVAGLVLLRLRQREARLEARVVHRRHERRREERTHRLADEVGRRDARDPEPVRRLGRDRRLAGSRGAADEQDDRHVELLQRVQPAEPAHRAAALVLAEHLGGELAEPVEVDAVGAARRRSASARRASSYARVTLSPVAASARAIRPFDQGGPSSPPSGSGAR